MRNWTEQEVEILKKIYNTATKKELLETFKNKTLQNIASRAAFLKLPKRDKSIDINKDDYPYISHVDNTKHKTTKGLFEWNKKKHNISIEQTILQMSYNGIRPTCKCGCGGEVQIKPGTLLFKDYQKGHYTRIHNPTRDNPEIAQRAFAKAKQMWVEGLKNGTNKIWNDGLTKDTDERVKKYGAKRKGKTIDEIMKDPEKVKELRKTLSDNMKKRAVSDPNFNDHMKIYWKDENNRKEQSKRKVDWLTTNQNEIKKSATEDILEFHLIKNNIQYEKQFRIANKLFDFKILNTNIIIEVDGDFWHCNPEKYPEGPTYATQKKTVANDIIKNKLIEINDYKLLRFWQSTIDNQIDLVIKNILKEIKSVS